MNRGLLMKSSSMIAVAAMIGMTLSCGLSEAEAAKKIMPRQKNSWVAFGTGKAPSA